MSKSATLAVLYIIALAGLALFQFWSLAAAIVGAILVIMVITIYNRSRVTKKIAAVEQTMETRHRELSEKVGQQLLFFSNEIESTKGMINRGLFSIEARLGRVGEMETKYQHLIEKLISIENKIGEVRHSVEERKPAEEQIF